MPQAMPHSRDKSNKNVKKPKKSELEKKALKSVVGESSSPMTVEVVKRKRKTRDDDEEDD